ncbi:MAG TPA: response regulator [Alphaproteobacteria bacterium]|nr:response regulator [Alphaproteobacteria bacterium]
MQSESLAPKILNVDDDAASRYVKSRVLTREGYTVLECATGSAALDAVAAEQPQLVLLDTKLPDLNGLEVCRKIKERWGSGVLVLQTSAAYVSSSDRVAALDRGADGFLVAPMEPAELVAQVRALLRLQDVEQALRNALEEKQALVEAKEELLHELNHQVKNSLQLVSSLLSLQQHAAGDAATKDQFEAARRRVAVVARVYQRLYQTEHIETLDFGGYLRHFCEELAGQEAGESAPVLEVAAVPAELPANAAIHLALVLGEMLTNAYRHAAARRIAVAFGPEPDGRLRLTVTDDGVGVPEGFDPKRPASLGMRLVTALVGQLQGTLAVERLAPGTRFVLALPKPQPR